jgi:hypothetical protein
MRTKMNHNGAAHAAPEEQRVAPAATTEAAMNGQPSRAMIGCG